MPDTAPAMLPGVPRWRRGGSMECVLTPQTDSAGQYVRSSQSGVQVCGSGWFCSLCALRTYCPALFVCSRKHCISIDLPPPTRNTRQHGRGRVRHAPASLPLPHPPVPARRLGRLSSALKKNSGVIDKGVGIMVY